jgi:hypothetical protein
VDLSEVFFGRRLDQAKNIPSEELSVANEGLSVRRMFWRRKFQVKITPANNYQIKELSDEELTGEKCYGEVCSEEKSFGQIML